MLLKAVFWGSLGALAWTHAGYPVAAEIAASLRPRPVRKDDTAEPTVTVIVAAYNEEAVIERRLRTCWRSTTRQIDSSSSSHPTPRPIARTSSSLPSRDVTRGYG